MKTILLPVGMSDENDHSVQYAVGLARSAGASIILCHTYIVPVPPTEVPVLVMPVEEMRVNNLKALEAYARKLRIDYSDVNFGCTVKADDVEHGVAAAALEAGADIIVMGLSENDIGHFIFGHNASGVVNHTEIPVLMLPPGAGYKPIRKVVLACDLHDIHDRSTFHPLHKLLSIFDPELMIVHIVEDESQLAAARKALTELSLDQLFAGFRHSFHFPVHEDVVLGINEFAERSNADMIVSVHHTRGFFKRLFTTLHTRQMSFSANVPVLVLHG